MKVFTFILGLIGGLSFLAVASLGFVIGVVCGYDEKLLKPAAKPNYSYNNK